MITIYKLMTTFGFTLAVCLLLEWTYKKNVIPLWLQGVLGSLVIISFIGLILTIYITIWKY